MHSQEHEERCLLYDAGELAPREVAAFESELSRCGGCRCFLAELREWRRLSEESRLSPSPGLHGRILASLPGRSAPEPVSGIRAFMGLSLAAACAVALVLFGRGPAPSGDRSVKAPAEELEWTSGLDAPIAELDTELETFSQGLALADSAEEIDLEFDELEDLAAQFDEMTL